MPTTRELMLDRLTSLCVGAPFSFTRAVTPFDFDQQPTGVIDRVCRIEVQEGPVIGGFNFSEDRTDLFTVWIARKQHGTPQAAYRLLTSDVSSLTSAIIHHGAQGGGDFAVPDDGRGVSFQHDPGREYAVARLAVPINYEVDL